MKQRPWWKPSNGGGTWTRPDEKEWHEPEPVNVTVLPAPEREVVLIPWTHNGTTSVQAVYRRRTP